MQQEEIAMRENWNRYITINPRICNGKPVLKGTRIPLTVILDQLAAGCSFDDLLRKYPELSREQIQAVLAYCHEVIERTEIEMIPA